MHIYIRGRVNAFGTITSEHSISFYDDFLIKIIYEEPIKNKYLRTKNSLFHRNEAVNFSVYFSASDMV